MASKKAGNTFEVYIGPAFNEDTLEEHYLAPVPTVLGRLSLDIGDRSGFLGFCFDLRNKHVIPVGKMVAKPRTAESSML